MLNRVNGRMLALVVAIVLIAGVLIALSGSSTRTVTVHFNQAISIYQGSDVDVMGVKIGTVTAVVPEGDSVRVDIRYDAKYKLPVDVKAAIITPTLVADRFVQLAPAYDGGPVLADGGDVPLARTAVPVELDRIYSSLADLSRTLGPNGANRTGALSDLLGAGARALKGNGELGNQMLSNLSAAAQTLGNNSDQIFGTVDSLASLTRTLNANDRFVGSFMTHLSKVSTQLAGERGDLRKALVAIANAVGVVRSFVHDNKSMLIKDVKGLTETVGVLAQQKDTLATVLQLAPLGLGNLAEAFDPASGTVGIRLQLGPTASDLGNILCAALKTNGVPNVAPACALLKALIPTGAANLGAGLTSTLSGLGAGTPAAGLIGLLGGVTGIEQ